MSKKISEIMNTKLETISSDDSVYSAIEKMIDRRIRSLLVLPKDEKDEYGVVTVRNIIFKVLTKKLDPHKIRIGEIASKPVIAVSKDASIEDIYGLMEKNNIARVFVKEGNKIIGVVSFFDIMYHILIERAKT
ncbi:putative signal transduction protein with CBS domains [Thermodesulfobacterium geofontis OPF15]|jgi:CBS domain-containing protein|uniref:Putative signal transduction protein with CBS domains n=1 Tax=Thermodesulfobacterium geofontis (strain OPF15) TaxID=795359 RepID=F8C4Q7_THEGP|nr:CBS domain-containing protein [Thermodesulfobacterium geofontis]AEH22729.1 putative signal transduction protein with CBS domains [Thermodesulfobacterium geofontis OPF15]